MGIWQDTYQKDTVKIDGYAATASVYSAIHEPSRAARCELEISVDTEHGIARGSLNMTASQLRDLSHLLRDHACRLEYLDSKARDLFAKVSA
ncbi:MAG: hypothetical protein KA307_02345 [Burkholderiaceae bacterium]|nr:hypothetical protein [Burkholderiaceae bacterium]